MTGYKKYIHQEAQTLQYETSVVVQHVTEN